MASFVENINKLALVSESLPELAEALPFIQDNIDEIVTVSNDLTTDNFISTVGLDLQKGDLSNIRITADNINAVASVGLDLLEPVSEINTVASNMGLVDIVGQDLANQYVYIEDNGSITSPVEADEGISRIGTVAENIDSVITVADNIEDIIDVSNSLANISTVLTITDNINTVAGISTDVSTVANNDSNITIVADNILDINTVVDNVDSINTVSSDIGSVSTVATSISDVVTVATDILDVSTVSSNILAVGTVANSISDVSIVSANIVDVSTVASISTDISTVAGIDSDVTAVAGLSSDITFLATNWDDKVNTTDIGVTVQGYDVDTVIDSEYATKKTNWDDAYTHVSNDGTDHSYIDQDVTTTGTPTFASIQLSGGIGTQGTVSWNTDEETLDLIQNGAILQLGQELQVHCRNGTTSTIANGKVVMAYDTIGASGRIKVKLYDGTSDVKYIVGIATEDIAAGDDGKITVFGKVRGINTYSYNENDVLYPTTSGNLTNVAPISGVKNSIALVINKHAVQGTLMVRFTPTNENAYVPLGSDFTLDLGTI